MTAFQDYCIRVFSKVRPQATFLSIKGYRNNWNEISNFSVVFHANYLNAIHRSQNIVRQAKCPDRPLYSDLDFKVAKNELLDSFAMTVNGDNPFYTGRGIYSQILDADGKAIPGIKLHTRLDEVHINARLLRKTVITPVTYNYRDSTPKTIAKNYLRSLTPVGKWVQFKLLPCRFDELVVQRMRIK